MTYHTAYEEAVGLLGSAGIEEASIDAGLLLEFVSGMKHIDYVFRMNEAMPPYEEARYRKLVDDRAGHIPLQQLTGEQVFMGLYFKVNEHVLCPRQDTETLVEESMKRLSQGMKVLDLCCGSGCILISLMALGADALEGTGSDISPDALKLAQENAILNHVRPQFIQSDLFERITGPFDMIVSNPPYIPTGDIEELMPEVRDHEPRIALDGSEDGLFFYRRIIPAARRYLRGPGWLMMEIGYDEGDAVRRLMKENGYKDVSVIRDLGDNDRVVSGHL